MRVNLLYAAMAVVSLSTMVVADKVTVDPNTLPPKQTAASTPVDARMAKKITYFSGYTRLHYVTEEIARQTGTTIRCGKDKNDWPVRDLPLTVCANDIPADKLLQAVADATHTLLTVIHVNGKDFYKVWKDWRREKVLDDCFNAERKYARARDEYAWDAAIKSVDLPDSAFSFEENPDMCRELLHQARDIGPTLKHIDRGVLDRVFAGEMYCLDWKDVPADARPPLKDLLGREMDRCVKARQRQPNYDPAKLPRTELTDQDLERAFVRLRLIEGDYPHVEIDVALKSDVHDPKAPTPTYMQLLLNYGWFFEGLADPSFPKPPKKPDPLNMTRFKGDIGNPNLHELVNDQDWEMPPLEAKTKLDQPKDRTVLTLADAVLALARASGFSFVCEDFETHSALLNADGVFGSEATLGDLLKRLSSVTWLVDEKHKLIVGWERRWYEHHWNLIPESVVADLQRMLNGEGVELVDFVQLMLFTSDQRKSWLSRNRFLEGIRRATVRDSEAPLWEMYARLSSRDKAFAKSETGLPLWKLDTDWLSGIFAKVNKSNLQDPFIPEEVVEKLRANHQLPTDPYAVARLSLRVVKRKLTEIPAPKHAYRIEILGSLGDRDINMSLGELWGIGFPAYSPKREAEIADGKAKNDSDAKTSP